MKNKKNLSIALAFFVTCLLIYIGFARTAALKEDIRDNLINEYAEQQHLIALQLAQILELELSQRQAELKLIATLPEVVSGNTATCNAKLKEIFEDERNKLGNYGRIDKNGFFTCSLNEKLIGIKGETLGTYIKDIFNDPEHKPVMSQVIKPVGTDSYVIAIHVPVLDESGAFNGTLGGAIYLDDLKEKYLKNIEMIEGGDIAIFDQDGTVLNHYKPELIGINITTEAFKKRISNISSMDTVIANIKNGTSGTRRYYFDNVEKIAAIEPVHVFRDRNWSIIITIPTSYADRNIIKLGADKVLSVRPVIFGAIILVFFATFLITLRNNVGRNT